MKTEAGMATYRDELARVASKNGLGGISHRTTFTDTGLYHSREFHRIRRHMSLSTTNTISVAST